MQYPNVRKALSSHQSAAGYAVDAASKGLLEDIRMALEIGVTRFIDAIRRVVRTIFFLPPKTSSNEMAEAPRLTRHHTAPLPVRPYKGAGILLASKHLHS